MNGRIIRMHHEANRAQLGGKAWALASAQRAGLPVPAWFVVPAAARRDGEEVTQDLRNALMATLEEVFPRGAMVAVRSSAVEEDGERLSFAGQLESHLFVRADRVPDRVADVWRSAGTARARAYRELRGSTASLATAVLVQQMIDAETAGVAFSADPVSGRRALAVVAAATGTAEKLVLGERDADTFHVRPDGAIASRSCVAVTACLTDAQVREVAALARRCARHFGSPQDIEWAYSGGRLWLLQSRPITSLAGLADPDGELAIWDSSNIAESYGGTTTPLTFSFIRRCYEHAYRELGRLGGVAEEAIRANDDAYRRMLGFVRGRVYYNLIVWYRLLALAPGFRYNRQFLDEMLGVAERADVAALLASPPASGWAALRGAATLVRQLFRTAGNFLTVERRNRRFRARLDAALRQPAVPLEDMRLDELAGHYRQLERALLMRWDAPLVNDFFAMIFHGLLRRLIARWLEPGDAGIDNRLLSGESGIISFEPVRRIREMAAQASAESDLAAALRQADRHAALARLERSPRIHALYREYLARFAERCPEELKLESVPLDVDPLPLLRAIGHLAASPRAGGDGSGVRSAAEARVACALRRRPLRRALFAWVLHHARVRVRDRENLRFERTRIFGRVRRIILETGKRLRALGQLDEARDVFWLELEEILGFVDGTATCADLRALAAVRKAQLERSRAAEAPPRRFETRGVGQIELGLAVAPRAAGGETGEARHATGCCPGIVRGRVRVLRSADAGALAPGEILVAERTDPGWVMLFAAAAGLIVERGSLLSHAAIVAREMALPAVVGVAGATHWLCDGDLVELDGASGLVRRLERAAAQVSP